MTKKNTVYLNQFVRETILKIRCFFLLVKNLLLNTKLQVKGILLYERFVVEGSKIILHWDAKGCHKITIKNVGTFRGNISGISFPIRDITKPIEICFYGVSEKAEKKFFVNGAKVSLLDSFDANLLLPIAVEAVHQSKNLKCDYESSNLQVCLPEVQFKVNVFDKKNY